MGSRTYEIAVMLMIVWSFSGAKLALAGQTEWPSLPAKGFIVGRVATQKDVSEGNAAFAADIGGKTAGKPIPIVIPQYAYLAGQKEEKMPVIVIQAEEDEGLRLYGVRDFSGHDLVATEPELTLLGIAQPH